MEHDQLLQKAFSFADAMKVYKDECCDLVASALQVNNQLECDGEWANQLLDMHDSLFAWHQLDSLASFLQSEEIASMLSYYRGKLAEKCATSSISFQPSHTLMDIPSLLPALSDILHDAEAVRTLNELSNWEAEKATVLLRQCLHVMPIDSPDSLAAQIILRNLQPSHSPHLQHITLSESPEFDQFCDIGPIEPGRRLLRPQFSTAQSIESNVADPILPNILQMETLSPINEEFLRSSITPVSPRLPSFSWEELSSRPENRRLLPLSRCECFKHSSTGQHRPWCSQTTTPYPPLIITPPIPRADPRPSLPTTVSEISSPFSSTRSLASTSRPLPAVPISHRLPASHRDTPHDLPQVVVDSPISATTITPTATLVRPLGSGLDAAIRALNPTARTHEHAPIDQKQPLLLPSPVNSPPDDDLDADLHGPSPIIAGTIPSIDFSTCLACLQVLIEEEEKLLQDNWDANFATILRNANPPLVPLNVVDDLISSTFGAFLQIRTAHSLALAAVKSLTKNFKDLGSIETLFTLTRDIMARFSSLYPEYAQGLKNLHTIMEGAMEAHQSFRVWMEAGVRTDRLHAFLRRPFERLEGYFSTLREIVEFIEGEAGKRYTYEIRKQLTEWESLICQTRLWGWQSSMGHDPLFNRGFEELTSISDDPAERGGVRLARQRAMFKVVELQMFFVDMLKGLNKGVRIWLSTASNPPSDKFTGLLDTLNILLHHHTALLVELHNQQRLHHPQMPRLLSALDQSSKNWSNPYHQYCQILTECQSEIHSFQLDDLAFLPDTTHPLLHGKDLLTLLRAPLLHLRHLNRRLRSLMDATPDDHPDMRCLVEVLSTLSALADQCQGYNCWTGVNLHLQELIMQLVWTEASAGLLGIEEPWRKLVDTGWLFLPRTRVVSGPQGPGGNEMGPHGTSDYSELLDVFVVILDNCMLVTKSVSRWGVRRFVVLKAIRLSMLGLASEPSGDRLYLLDGPEEKRVAAPLELRDESKDETFTLYAPTTAVASTWKEWLLSAKSAPDEIIRQSSKLFRTRKIADLDSHPQCSTIISVNGKEYLLFGGGFGHPGGVWIVTQDEPRTLVIAGSTLKQCAVIEPLGMIFMLLGKGLHYHLYAYKLEDLVSPDNQNLDQSRVVIRYNVTFFRVGCHRSQPFLVITTETTRATQIQWYIPPVNTTGFWRRTLFTKDGGPLFQKIGKYETNVRVWDVEILPEDEGLVLMGESGFQLIKMDKSNRFEITTLPQLSNRASSHVAQRCRTTKPIGIAKIDSEFLLCYSDFGVYTTPQGQIYGRTVDWDTSQRMTHVSFLPPYFLLVSGTSIEIRIIKDGRHVQTIKGKNVRLIRPIGEVRGSSRSGKETRRDDIQRMHIVLDDPPDERSKVELLELDIPVLDVSSP